MVGKIAPKDFIDELRQLVSNHDEGVAVDRVLAYYSGSKYNVEVDLVLPRDLNVEASHDVALNIQKMLEDLPDVERANIHVS